MSLAHKWSSLSRQQLGHYAEYLVKMELTLHGLDIYTPEVDDKGIDFIVRQDNQHYSDIQVKSCRNLNPVVVNKSKFFISGNLYLALVLFIDDQIPELFLIPSIAWNKPNVLLVDRDYEGLRSQPDYGINLSNKNLSLLEDFRFDKMVYLLKP